MCIAVSGRADRDRKRLTADQLALLGTLLAMVIVSGCLTRQDAKDAEEPNPAFAKETRESPPQELPELWYVNYVLGERVGYERQCFARVAENGRQLRKTTAESRLRVKRSNAVVEMAIRHTCWETLDGRPVRFEVETNQGGSLSRSEGRVDNGQLVVTIQVAGRTLEQVLPCPVDCRGFLGLQESLYEDPMMPGDRRQLTILVPGLNDIATLTLEASNREAIQVGQRTIQCLPIQFAMALRSGSVFRGRLWVDDRGIIVKQETDSPQMTLILANRDEALQEPHDPALDLVRDIRVPVNLPPSDPEHAVQAVYRMSSTTENLGGLIPSDQHQTVKSLGDRTVEICVHPPRFPPVGQSNSEITDSSATKPSIWIQSDAPEIIELADMAAAGQSEWQDIVPALCRFVYRTVKNKGYDHAFLSALEVAQRKEGDCTEHAVLLAALVRARGIPARVAVGLVFRDNAFYYHMWTEVFVNGCWVGFDATREGGIVTPGYIKLGQDALSTADGLGVFLPAMKLVGQIKIECLRVE